MRFCISTQVVVAALLPWPGPSKVTAEGSGAPIEASTAASHDLKGPAIDAAAIDAAAQYLVSRCDEAGQFLYRENSNPRVKLKQKYNMLRHAGAIYALAMVEKKVPDETSRNAIRRAVGFLRAESLRPVPDVANTLAIWSDPKLTGSDKPLQAKLGGAGLALVALVAADEVLPGVATIEECRGLARFILFMQKPDGSFYSKFVPGAGGRDDAWGSLYYPGEAALGLLMLYETDRNAAWLRGAGEALRYLATKRKGQARVEADHWAMIATGRLLHHVDHPDLSIDRHELLRHAGQISSSIIARKAIHPADARAFGSFMQDGRTCPTSTRLEGLLAALAYAPARDRPALASCVDESMPFLANSQIRTGPYAGGIPRAVATLPEDHPQYSEAFNWRATEIRIDYVQHAICAMLMYNEMLSGE